MDTKQLLEQLDIKPEALRELRLNWRKIVKECVIVSPHIGYWRAKSALDFDGLGLTRDETDNLVNLGSRRLLPIVPADSPFYEKKYPKRTIGELFGAYEQRCRRAAQPFCVKTPYGYLLPVDQFEEAQEAMEAAKAEYQKLIDYVYETWQQNVDAVMVEYDAYAEHIFLRMTKLDKKRLTDMGWKTLKKFKVDFLARVQADIPDADRFKGSFYIHYALTYLPLPDILAQETAQAQVAAESAALETAKLRSERAEESVRAEELTGKQKALQAMHKAVAAQEEQRVRRMTNEVVEGVVRQSRETVDKAVTEALTSIQRGGRLQGPVSAGLSALVEKASTLFQALGRDEEVAMMLAPLKAELERGGKRNLDGLTQILSDIQVTARASVVAMSTNGRGLANRDLEVAGLTVGEVKAARGRLNLETKVVNVNLNGSTKRGAF